MTTRRKLRAQVADLTRQLDAGRQVNAALLDERDTALTAAAAAREDAQRLARQVVDLTARAEKLAGDLAFAERVAKQYRKDAEREAAAADLWKGRASLLVRVGDRLAAHAPDRLGGEWADAKAGVAWRDARGRFLRREAS